jgi:iron complex outermembrane recepter protein
MQKLFVLCLILPLLWIANIFAQDTLNSYQLAPVEIVARKNISIIDKNSFGTDYSSSLFDKNGYNLVRRGSNFTQDLYVEGFKRSDIKVLIDGEQYHNACPNRMDAPAIRLNPLEMQSVDLSKSGSLINSGLYGKVEYHRSEIDEQIQLKTSINGSAGAQKDYDAAAIIEGYKTNLSVRYSIGFPYENGDGKRFTDLYNYKDNFKYNYGSIGLRHEGKDYKMGVSYTISEDISFPFLMMDEIYSRVYSAFFELDGNKLYLNYTDHLMDNTLRKSNMLMMTDTKNLTVGLTGSFYEVIYRRWDADNIIENPAMNLRLSNHLMPQINLISATGAHRFNVAFLTAFVKGGLQYYSIGDIARLDVYKTLYSSSEDNRIFFNGGINLFYSGELTNDITFSVSAEAVSEVPEAEQLFIAVERPMTNPSWFGNPTLEQPVRTGLRSIFDYSFVRIEGFANYIYNYVNIVKKNIAAKGVMTYDNINAAIMGVNLMLNYKFFETNLSYLYGENLINPGALAEITPLVVTSKIDLPEFSNFSFSIIHRYENSQKRIDNQLNEFPSSAWNTISLGVRYKFSDLVLNIEAENLLNHNYSRFLSYSRNPFSAGTKVFDPGRTFRLSLYYNKLF